MPRQLTSTPFMFIVTVDAMNGIIKETNQRLQSTCFSYRQHPLTNVRGAVNGCVSVRKLLS
jgi:hypothetical protein